MHSPLVTVWSSSKGKEVRGEGLGSEGWHFDVETCDEVWWMIDVPTANFDPRRARHGLLPPQMVRICETRESSRDIWHTDIGYGFV